MLTQAAASAGPRSDTVPDIDRFLRSERLLRTFADKDDGLRREHFDRL